MKPVAVVVLAGGKGTRMKSARINKVALPVSNRPLISYTISTLKKLETQQIIVVVGFAAQSVIQVLGSKVEYAHQRFRLGTAHALKCALPHLKPNIKLILTMYGDDSAFYPKKLLQRLIKHHLAEHSAVTFLTVIKTDPTGLGRIIRNQQGEVEAIVEEKNASLAQKAIREINTGLYCFNREFIEKNIQKITKNPISGEYYLTDIIEIAKAQGAKVSTIISADDSVWHGVNTPAELAAAKTKMAIPLDV